MSTRRKKLDNIYIPKPTEWDWKKIDPAEAERRLDAARDTAERLEAQAFDLRQQRDQAKRELWTRLPDALLYETSAKLGQLEEMGKQLTAIARQRAQVDTAITYIEERLYGARVAK